MRFVSAFFAVAVIGFVTWAGFHATPRSRAPSLLLPGEHAIIAKMVYACDKKHLDRLDGLAVAKDREAYAALLVEQILLGGCIVFAPGDTLYVEDVSLFSGATKVRRVGDITSWWVTSSILDAQTKIGGPK